VPVHEHLPYFAAVGEMPQLLVLKSERLFDVTRYRICRRRKWKPLGLPLPGHVTLCTRTGAGHIRHANMTGSTIPHALALNGPATVHTPYQVSTKKWTRYRALGMRNSHKTHFTQLCQLKARMAAALHQSTAGMRMRDMHRPHHPPACPPSRQDHQCDPQAAVLGTCSVAATY
jgi:hypothetical protein